MVRVSWLSRTNSGDSSISRTNIRNYSPSTVFAFQAFIIWAVLCLPGKDRRYQSFQLRWTRCMYVCMYMESNQFSIGRDKLFQTSPISSLRFRQLKDIIKIYLLRAINFEILHKKRVLFCTQLSGERKSQGH